MVDLLGSLDHKDHEVGRFVELKHVCLLLQLKLEHAYVIVSWSVHQVV